jgi:phosphopantetheinyl transferase (holo-ACP synthase)
MVLSASPFFHILLRAFSSTPLIPPGVGIAVSVNRSRASTLRKSSRCLGTWPCELFPNSEIRALRASDDPCPLFHATWTEKETIVKALGSGLSDDLRCVEVSPQPSVGGRLLSLFAKRRASDRRLRPWDPGPGYSGCLSRAWPRFPDVFPRRGGVRHMRLTP